MSIFPDEVYVFTPIGEVIALPDGASPVDFAYFVHTDIGHYCLGAKINGKTVHVYQIKNPEELDWKKHDPAPIQH